MALVSMLRRISALRRMPLATQQVHTSAGRGAAIPLSSELTPGPTASTYKFGPSAQWISAGMMLRMRRPRAAMSVAGRWAEGVLTIREEESVAEAVRIMAAHDVGCLVVMDSAAQHVTGIVTERVYSREIILKGRDSDLTPVGEVMKTDVVYVHIEEKLGDIAQVLSTHGVRHLPVLEGDVGSPVESAAADGHVRRLHTPAAQLKGVLSIKDVCWMLFCLVRNELQGRGIGTMTVMDVLEGHHHRKHPYTIQMGASVLQAIEQMATTDAHALCVLDDNGGLLGILTEVRLRCIVACDARRLTLPPASATTWRRSSSEARRQPPARWRRS